jgi:hypothetical protein
MSRSAIRWLGPLERQKHAFLSELNNWLPAQISFRCAPGSWCALEVLDHVVKAERGILVDIQWNLGRPEPVPLSHRIRSEFLILFMRTPARVRVPGPLSQVLPDNNPDLPTLIESWNDSQIRIKEWLEEFRGDTRATAAFYHPVSGWMSVSQALGFIAAHTRHHRYQLARIRRNTAWSRAR